MRRLLLAFVALAALLVPASSALAAPHNPTGEYAQFNDCPLSRSTLTACFFSETKSGTITIGKKSVPIKNPVVLQGGLEYEGLLGPIPLIAAEDGNTLVKTPQPVPGGLLGVTAPSWWPSILRDLFNETINNGFTGVTATMELAAPANQVVLNMGNLLFQSGPALILPVKVKLSNPFLGSNCYIGSNSSPIKLNLTTGTTAPPAPNKPISGASGTFSQNENSTIFSLTGSKLVDNSFAAPGANGCGGILFSWAVDPFVNSIVGVPSAAGTNTAILESNVKIGEAAAVRESE
ncbi:MAG TPA: hypothetical protein VFN92_04915 [Solirubrobacterales bacterium]|nr:hypothetical protein [Solirubrobacterales bacterium]